MEPEIGTRSMPPWPSRCLGVATPAAHLRFRAAEAWPPLPPGPATAIYATSHSRRDARMTDAPRPTATSAVTASPSPHPCGTLIPWGRRTWVAILACSTTAPSFGLTPMETVKTILGRGSSPPKPAAPPAAALRRGTHLGTASRPVSGHDV
eukprot:scaffold12551_cov84-Isochrysis_galbana.AAC.1